MDDDWLAMHAEELFWTFLAAHTRANAAGKYYSNVHVKNLSRCNHIM